MSRAEENRKALGRLHPRALARLDEAPAGPGSISVVETPSGFPTAVRDGLSVHSRRDPRREAAAQVAATVEDSATAAIVLGFGLGYGVEALRARFPELPILVLEPDADMFRAALASRDLAAILSDERVSFLVASRPEEISASLASLPLARPAFLRLRPAVQRDPGWFRAAEEIVRSWLLRRDININTLNRFGRLWVRNLVRNAGTFADAPGISRLAGLFEGLPCLVLAGGPSLDEILPHLAGLSQRLLIISVNTPLKRCREAGVEPDFIVVVDPQYWASRFMDWAPPGGASEAAAGPAGKSSARRGIIVAEPSTHPRVFRDPHSPVYLCSSLFPLGETLETAVGPKGKLGAGGSVSTAAWDLARHLGASPIYTAGLDLGFPGMRTHCKGVFTEDLWLAACGRLAPLEESGFRYLREIGVFPVRSSSGGTVHTDRRMLIYKWWFENQLAQRPGLRSFTLSAGGVAIEGMPLESVGTLMALPVIREEIDARIEREKNSPHEAGPAAGRRTALADALRELRARLHELSLLAEEALRTNAELGSAVREGRDTAPVLELLDALDGRILEISERSVAGFLVQPVIHRITSKGGKKASAAEVLADGEALYGGILESARWQRDLVERAPVLLPYHQRDSSQGSGRSADLL